MTDDLSQHEYFMKIAVLHWIALVNYAVP